MKTISFPRCLLACAILVTAAIGCTKPSSPPIASSNTTTEVGATEPTDVEDVAVEIPLEIKSWDETQEWVASQKGKVVVLDLWSNW